MKSDPLCNPNRSPFVVFRTNQFQFALPFHPKSDPFRRTSSGEECRGGWSSPPSATWLGPYPFFYPPSFVFLFLLSLFFIIIVIVIIFSPPSSSRSHFAFLLPPPPLTINIISTFHPISSTIFPLSILTIALFSLSLFPPRRREKAGA